MNTATLIQRIGLFLGLGLLTGAVGAQGPSGPLVSPTYSGPGKGVFVFHATQVGEEFSDEEGGSIEISMAANAASEASGKIYGQTATTIHIEQSGDLEITFPGTCSLKGSMKSSGTQVRFTGKLSASGVAFLENANRKVSMSVNYQAILDPATGWITGTKSGRASASGLGSVGIEDPVFDNPIADAGVFHFKDWQLEMLLQTSGSKVTGTATVLVGDRETSYPCTVSGKYTAQNGVSSLKITGTGTGKGIKLTAQLTGNQITSISGTLLGQSVSAAN